MESSLPSLYRPAGPFGGNGQLEVLVFIKLGDHLADQMRSASGAAVHRNASQMPQYGTEGPFEKAFLDHDLGVAAD